MLKEQQFFTMLKSRGLRLTRPRRLILEHLSDGGTHACAESIYEALKRGNSTLGRATVFRALKLFAQLGIADETQPTTVRRRFEVAVGKPHHDHMTCLGCGAVVEFSNCAIERLQETEAKRRGFRITGHCLEVRGYCRRCLKLGRGRGH